MPDITLTVTDTDLDAVTRWTGSTGTPEDAFQLWVRQQLDQMVAMVNRTVLVERHAAIEADPVLKQAVDAAVESRKEHRTG